MKTNLHDRLHFLNLIKNFHGHVINFNHLEEVFGILSRDIISYGQKCMHCIPSSLSSNCVCVISLLNNYSARWKIALSIPFFVAIRPFMLCYYRFIISHANCWNACWYIWWDAFEIVLHCNESNKLPFWKIVYFYFDSARKYFVVMDYLFCMKMYWICFVDQTVQNCLRVC